MTTPPPDANTAIPLSVTSIPTVTFEVGEAVLSVAAQRAIDEQSLLPKVLSGAYIRVEGNTDDRGNPAINRALSKLRAQAVISYLVSKYHLPENQFIAIGNGPDHPIVPNTTPEGRAMNRRTDISVIIPR